MYFITGMAQKIGWDLILCLVGSWEAFAQKKDFPTPLIVPPLLIAFLYMRGLAFIELQEFHELFLYIIHVFLSTVSHIIQECNYSYSLMQKLQFFLSPH